MMFPYLSCFFISCRLYCEVLRYPDGSATSIHSLSVSQLLLAVPMSLKMILFTKHSSFLLLSMILDDVVDQCCCPGSSVFTGDGQPGSDADAESPTDKE